MLRLILNRHPQLAIPPESHFLIPLLQKIPTSAVLTSAQVRAAVGLITGCDRFATWHISREDVVAAARKLAVPRLRDLVDAVFRLETSATGATRWGDKTPEYTPYVAHLHRLFPEASFIHIVRDGRDVSISLRKRKWHGWTEYQRARYWASAVLAAEAAGSRIGPKQYLRVSYEDLVRSLVPTTQRICGFLGIEYHESMAEFHRDSEDQIAEFERKAGIHRKLSRAPKPTDVERWRVEASPVRVLLFESVAGRAMDHLNIRRRWGNKSRLLPAMTSCIYRPLGYTVACAGRLYHSIPDSIRSNLRKLRLIRGIRTLLRQC